VRIHLLGQYEFALEVVYEGMRWKMRMKHLRTLDWETMLMCRGMVKMRL
jgi:hypothetical protein